MENIKNDQEVQIVQKAAEGMIDKANALEVNSELQGKSANDILVGIKGYLSKLEVRRKFFVKPMQDHVKTINTEFKKLSVPLQEAYDIVRPKLTHWVVAKEAKDRKAAEEQQKEINSFMGSDEKPVVAVKPKGITSSTGKSHTSKIWKFEVVDLSKVPDDYKVADEKKIGLMLRANTKNVKGENVCTFAIPGVRIYQESILNVR